ncbi:prephenate dehydrogenase TyrA [Gottschalkia purinilytica]|uniref:Prephenate dehydrogenase TyrA n=1 Tax=Gottschalkia purinilytica TaxID=1503 RepID=A0A0L0WF01_GOTPU|nr:prephenate dehydrogenase [Gottschalkia purinilytica]KNF09995.1 prephenate dehydrogenase TyrA [Gottschalkia purinilytica]
MEFDFNITIVGLGLIGGSFAMALRDLKPKNLWAIDIDTDAMETAERLNIIDKGYTNPEVPLKKSDIVILCVYPELTIKFIKDNLKYFKSGAIITDTAGIKDKVINEINTFIREDIDFIGGHPMAGKESKGLQYASKDIFDGANYIITPIPKNNKHNVSIIEDIATKIGCKSIIKIDPKTHDEVIAYTSQLPHVLAVALMNCNNIENVETFIGGSFRDTTRVAKINSKLWSELLMENKENILNQIDLFQAYISSIKEAIENERMESLEDIFSEASSKKGEAI